MTYIKKLKLWGRYLPHTPFPNPMHTCIYVYMYQHIYTRELPNSIDNFQLTLGRRPPVHVFHFPQIPLIFVSFLLAFFIIPLIFSFYPCFFHLYIYWNRVRIRAQAYVTLFSNALQIYMHEMELVHRDVKPANILLHNN